MTRIFLWLVGVVVAMWIFGALVQGLLVSTSLTARKIWLFTWLWERFALGLLVGFALGFGAALLTARRRPVRG
ncbi:MAG TPA: hypothetical protein VE693_13800 [Gaiellaceae bacterium]|jgi:hypothetical protein|nr:hypothetical protein [Gaiellaceae bacterium]